ncbi:hypothetical protein N9M41_08225 [Rhodopirellula sp.]|nr:hypothetical protein [Rhodopirellula sp.]
MFKGEAKPEAALVKGVLPVPVLADWLITHLRDEQITELISRLMGVKR